MKSMSCHRSNMWTARIVAGLVLFMALGTALADPADRASTPARAATTKTHSDVAPAPRSIALTPVSNALVAPSTSPASLTVICFQSSIRCFSAKSATAAAGSPARGPALDLRAPELSRVFSQAELSQKLQDPEDQYEITESVQVEGKRQLAPVSVGLMAIPWAIIHPTQAWRILMPLPEAK